MFAFSAYVLSYYNIRHLNLCNFVLFHEILERTKGTQTAQKKQCIQATMFVVSRWNKEHELSTDTSVEYLLELPCFTKEY